MCAFFCVSCVYLYEVDLDLVLLEIILTLMKINLFSRGKFLLHFVGIALISWVNPPTFLEMFTFWVVPPIPFGIRLSSWTLIFLEISLIFWPVSPLGIRLNSWTLKSLLIRWIFSSIPP